MLKTFSDLLTLDTDELFLCGIGTANFTNIVLRIINNVFVIIIFLVAPNQTTKA